MNAHTTNAAPETAAEAATEAPAADDGRERFSRKAEYILDVIDELLDVIEEENGALRAHDDRTVVELLERKDKLTRLYQEHMLAVAQNPKLIADASDGQRDEMREAAEDLREAVDENARLLKAEMEAGGRLLRAIVDAVRDRKQDTATYVRDGQMDEGVKAGKENALTFNQET